MSSRSVHTLGLAAVMFTCVVASAMAASYDWHVTQEMRAPDCQSRPVMLVNGEFQPTLRVTKGDELSINVFNDLPENSTQISEGISLHWHGFHMKAAQWYDGVTFIAHCPIRPGTNFTYKFKVDEPAGTYWWHDHSSGYRFDGLLGALIVENADNKTDMTAYAYDEELPPLLLQDWWNVTGTSQIKRLNQPFDAGKTTPSSGSWRWIGLPQSLLLNGRAVASDCVSGGAAPNITISCNVTSLGTGPTCAHEVYTVTEGKTYRLRLINGASLVAMTVCIEGHDMTVIQADARPVQPHKSPCVDLNGGQRLDVLLTADRPEGNYWITVQPQFRFGSANGYGVLQYSSVPAALPATPNPQPNATAPWSAADYAKLQSIATSDNSTDYGTVPAAANRTVLVNVTQPLLQQTGQLRWALNNVVEVRTPPCTPIMKTAVDNPTWTTQYAAPVLTGPVDSPLAAVLAGNSTPVVYLDSGKPALSYPAPGTHVVEAKLGDVLDFVIQNHAANAFNGDYRASGWNRTAMEQHPFHLHGYHFWVIGAGTGNWSASDVNSYNLDNPPLRDTATVYAGGWVAVRVKANNPGVWLLHCHILAHEFMGQGLLLVVEPSKVSAAPANLPPCSPQCTYNLANPGNSTSAAGAAPGLTPATGIFSPPPAGVRRTTNQPSAAGLGASLHVLGMLGSVACMLGMLWVHV